MYTVRHVIAGSICRPNSERDDDKSLAVSDEPLAPAAAEGEAGGFTRLLTLTKTLNTKNIYFFVIQVQFYFFLTSYAV